MPDATVLLGGRYRLDRLIASGGVAEVWEGTDEVLARPIAIKVLQSQVASQPGVAERFRREAIAAARLVHPGIVAIYDARVEGDDAFLVMELVRGTDLRRLLSDRGGRLSPRLAVAIAAEAAEALDHAHRAGIVHRDVKPANILCDGDQAKVADFGIAKAAGIDGDLTLDGTMVGTAAYLAPEQVSGGEVDARTDVYALGVVLYEMVCGRKPFVGDSEVAVAVQRLDRDPLRPRQVVAGVPRVLEDVILRAMERDPAKRFASAADMRAALLSIDLDDDAIPLVRGDDDTPPSGITPSFRESERSWFLPALAILLVAAALVVVGVVFVGTDVGHDLLPGGDDETPPAATPSAAVDVGSVRAYDPLGDGSEHDEDAPLAIDGNPTTAWTTSSYNRADLGGLKPGVGLVLQLTSRDTELRRIEVESPAPGWEAEVYVAQAASSDFPGGWGEPVATTRGDRELLTADLPEGTRGGAVLLWLTSVSPDGGGFRGVVGEVRLLG
jgi:serine/threonine-protein kinase